MPPKPRKFIPNKRRSDSDPDYYPRTPNEEDSSRDHEWIWIVIVCCFVFLPPTFRGLSRFYERRHYFASERIEQAFEPFRIDYECSYDASDRRKYRRRLYGFLLASAILVLSSLIFGFFLPVLGVMFCIGLPIAFLLWRDSNVEPPLKSVSYSDESVIFELADGRQSCFALDSGTEIQLSASVDGGGYSMSAIFTRGDEAAEADLDFVSSFDFIRNCVERDVAVNFGDSAPSWFRKGFESLPWWR